jgi:hypothetical protein
MIDLILLAFFLGVYYLGFWCGNRFHTLTAMKDAVVKWVGDWNRRP